MGRMCWIDSAILQERLYSEIVEACSFERKRVPRPILAGTRRVERRGESNRDCMIDVQG